jgi:hypothetical protein
MSCSVVALVAMAAGVQAATTLNVDCTAGGSINAALAGAPPPPEPLIILVHGRCAENVILERWDVTLRGVDPSSDGVAPTSGIGVLVRSAAMATLERIGMSGAGTGLTVTDRALVFARGCLFTGNTTGVSVRYLADAYLDDAVIQGNQGTGLSVSRESVVECNRCTIKENFVPGGPTTANVRVSDSKVTLNDGSVAGTGWGIDATPDADVSLTRTSVGGTSIAVRLTNARAALTAGTMDGPFRADASRITLAGVAQTAGTAWNQAQNGSFVIVKGSGATPSNLPRTTYVESFSGGTATLATTGPLTCRTGGNLSCDGSLSAPSSTCGLCVRP